jgi:hypothetical protein
MRLIFGQRWTGRHLMRKESNVAGEVVAIVRSRLESNIAFLQQYFVEPRLKAGVDASALTDGYKKPMLMLEEMETIVKSSGAATAASG